jgi:hypothetical protein
MEKLDVITPYGILYTESGDKGGKLHLTLFQLQTFPVIRSDGDTTGDSEILKTIIDTYPSFSVEFRGISKTRNGLFLCGYPDFDINIVRDHIRKECRNIVEPHPQDICHSTLFRFHTPPNDEVIKLINDTVGEFRNVQLLQFIPKTWEYGFGTWTQLDSQKIVIRSWNATPRWICHRGLKDGPNMSLENKESEIFQRLKDGWDVEFDVWYKDGTWWLGHDSAADQLIDLRILQHPRSWVHCKNLHALEKCIEMNNVHCFTHDSDEATLTSKQYIWCYPGHILGNRSVCVMPERAGLSIADMATCGAVCSDFIPSIYNAHSLSFLRKN